jgi:hypothetical protein
MESFTLSSFNIQVGHIVIVFGLFFARKTKRKREIDLPEI